MTGHLRVSTHHVCLYVCDDRRFVQAARRLAFVDDECLFLLAPGPKKLDEYIDKTLIAVIRIFQILRLSVNFNAGKTEAMIQYRGKNSSKALEGY